MTHLSDLNTLAFIPALVVGPVLAESLICHIFPDPHFRKESLFLEHLLFCFRASSRLLGVLLCKFSYFMAGANIVH